MALAASRINVFIQFGVERASGSTLQVGHNARHHSPFDRAAGMGFAQEVGAFRRLTSFILRLQFLVIGLGRYT